MLPRLRPVIESSLITRTAIQLKLPSMSATASRHTSSASISSRQTISNGYASSVGPGARPPSAAGRPPTSMGNFNQSVSGRQRANTRPRPATAMGNHILETEAASSVNQQNGMKTSVFFEPSPGPRSNKLRGYSSTNSFSTLLQEGNRRDFSLVTRMNKLSLDDDGIPTKNTAEDQVVLERKAEVPCPWHRTDVPMEHVTVRTARRDEVMRPKSAQPTDSHDTVLPPPRTPFRIIDPLAAMDDLETVIRTACKTPNASPTKLYSPCKQSFLTKESNLTGFTAWDVDERLHGIENQFKVMKEAMTLSLTDRKTLEDAVDMAKNQGMATHVQARLWPLSP